MLWIFLLFGKVPSEEEVVGAAAGPVGQVVVVGRGGGGPGVGGDAGGDLPEVAEAGDLAVAGAAPAADEAAAAVAAPAVGADLADGAVVAAAARVDAVGGVVGAEVAAAVAEVVPQAAGGAVLAAGRRDCERIPFSHKKIFSVQNSKTVGGCQHGEGGGGEEEELHVAVVVAVVGGAPDGSAVRDALGLPGPPGPGF